MNPFSHDFKMTQNSIGFCSIPQCIETHEFQINSHLVLQFPLAPWKARVQCNIKNYFCQTCLMWFSRRILFIIREKFWLDNSDLKFCCLPWRLVWNGLTLMWFNARAIKSVLLFLTTHPSKTNSRFGIFSDTTGPFSLFRTVVETFLM